MVISFQINLAVFCAGNADDQSALPKFPMSWRVTAYSMAKLSSANAAKSKSVCTLAVPYNQVEKYLNASLGQLGLTVVSAFPQAGQYLAVVTGLSVEDQLRGQLIIVAQPVGEDQTLLQTKIVGDGRLFDLKKVEEIPVLMNTMVQRKGLM